MTVGWDARESQELEIAQHFHKICPFKPLRHTFYPPFSCGSDSPVCKDVDKLPSCSGSDWDMYRSILNEASCGNFIPHFLQNSSTLKTNNFLSIGAADKHRYSSGPLILLSACKSFFRDITYSQGTGGRQKVGLQTPRYEIWRGNLGRWGYNATESILKAAIPSRRSAVIPGGVPAPPAGWQS